MKNPQKVIKQKRKRRKRKIRARISGISQKPRLSVYRSLKHIYAQIVDDAKGNTLAAASDLELTQEKKKKLKGEQKKVLMAQEVGKLMAQKALKKNIKRVVFDRGGYKYHGRVKALAEGAREGGLKF